MGLKPITTRWFEVLCPRNDVAQAAEALARTGHVQVEGESESSGDVSLSDLLVKLPELEQLERRYGRYWPSDVDDAAVASGSPEALLDDGLARLARWADDAEPIIVRLQALELETAQLEEPDRLEQAREALALARSDLERVHTAHGIRTALRGIRRLEWYVTCVPPPRHTRHFALVSGWTDAPDPKLLQRALDAAGIAALVSMPEPPEGRAPPMVLRNPAWARPFELFARLVGVPSGGEVDPSATLTIVAPLIFGYMFGDVGHGFVLLALGLALRRRIPAFAMLVPGGIAAMGFGLLFGSLFGVENVIPALWMHPMKEPLVLLFGSVVGGAAILLLGLLLGGLGATYERRFGRWLATDAAVIAIYVGVLLLVFTRIGAWIAIAGLVWFAAGHALVAEGHRLGSTLGAVGELAERLLQLGVNTVSFARVGAFALAHAGLSAAITGMLSSTDSTVGKAVVLLFGNALVLVVEGLVVSIQTTRLVLFEFFVRFFKAEGRAFAPLAPPSTRDRDSHSGRPALPRSGS